MPRSEITVILPVDAAKAWAYAADPGRLPRWWPSVDRVDRSDQENYTRWVISPRGKAVPMAFKLISLDPGEAVAWEQQLLGTPFAKAVSSAVESISVCATPTGSEVTISITRKLKGTARLGSLFVRRGQNSELRLAASQLKEAFNV